jgi:hypothetical protein
MSLMFSGRISRLMISTEQSQNFLEESGVTVAIDIRANASKSSD